MTGTAVSIQRDGTADIVPAATVRVGVRVRLDTVDIGPQAHYRAVLGSLLVSPKGRALFFPPLVPCSHIVPGTQILSDFKRNPEIEGVL